MKKILSAVLAAFAVLLLPAAAFAQDTVYQEAKVSQASSISGTGFSITALPSGCSAVLDTDEQAIVLKNSGSAANSAANCLYLDSWSSDKLESFVVEAKVKFDDLAGQKSIGFRFDNSSEYTILWSRNTLSVNLVPTEFIPEENRWYTIDIYVNTKKSPCVKAYIDGALIGGYDSNHKDNFVQSGVQLRLETIGKSSAMSVGDVCVFKPGDVKLLIENNELDTVDSPVKVSFDRAITPNITKEHVKVLDAEGGEAAVSDFEPKYNAGGDCIGFTLGFEESLNKRKVYHVELNETSADEEEALKLSGVFGQGVEKESGTFTVRPDNVEFIIDSATLYSGIAGMKTQAQKLGAGFQSFDITVRNDGIESGECVVIVELYDSDGKMAYSGGVKKTIAGFSEESVNIGAYLTAAPSYARIRVVDNYKDKNDLTEELVGGDIF